MIYVLDTNIILNNPSLSQYKGEIVYIPIAVMKELDNQKSRDGIVGFKSRLFHRKLKEVSSLNGETYEFDGVTILNPTVHYEELMCDVSINIADDWFVNCSILHKTPNFIAHTSDFSCYNLMRLNNQNCEYIPQQTKEDYSKLNNSYIEVYVNPSVISTLEMDLSEFNCMDYLLLIDNTNPNNKRLVKIRNGKLHHVEKITSYGIKPINIEQQILADALMDKEVKIVILSGKQGTGKTLLGLSCGLEQTINKNIYDRILLAKSLSPLSKDNEIGFLPGEITDKLKYSMVNYISNLEFLNNGVSSFSKDGKTTRVDGMKIYEELHSRGKIDFLPLDSILGASYNKTYVIIDESQSLDLKIIRSCLTRIKDNCKMVMAGDIAQQTSGMTSIDKSGLYLANKYLRNVKGVCVLTLSEVERGSVCRDVADALDKIEILG